MVCESVEISGFLQVRVDVFAVNVSQELSTADSLQIVRFEFMASKLASLSHSHLSMSRAYFVRLLWHCGTAPSNMVGMGTGVVKLLEWDLKLCPRY